MAAVTPTAEVSVAATEVLAESTSGMAVDSVVCVVVAVGSVSVLGLLAAATSARIRLKL